MRKCSCDQAHTPSSQYVVEIRCYGLINGTINKKRHISHLHSCAHFLHQLTSCYFPTITLRNYKTTKTVLCQIIIGYDPRILATMQFVYEYGTNRARVEYS